MIYPIFKPFAHMNQVIVTGSQRSGTHIGTKMIAADLGLPYVRETAIGFDNHNIVKRMIKERMPFVLQCPCLVYRLHLLPLDNVAVVFMRRSLSEIQESMERISWGGLGNERQRIKHMDVLAQPYKIDTSQHVAVVKYQYIDKHLKTIIPNWFDIEHKDLVDHPLWIDKKKRMKFVPHQTVMNLKDEDNENSILHKRDLPFKR